MFYYKNWEDFCSWVNNSGIKTCTAEESLSLVGTERKYIILKHDVETNVSHALKLAQIEHDHGIHGSYYIQAYLLESKENIKMLSMIRDMGHEVSYHYDVLDANNGDYIKAEKEFDKWLNLFDSLGFKFKTICQHGNPVKKRIGYSSNRDFFRNEGIKSRHDNLVDIVVNYSEHILDPYIYISDAGYMWKHITEPETNDLNPKSEIIKIGNFHKLRAYISKSDCSVILSTHPHRWMRSRIKIKFKIYIFRVVRSSAKILQRLPLVKTLLNKFYFLAKNI